MTKTLTFLKLGGSLITDKESASSPRPERIAMIAKEIGAVLSAEPEMQLLIGHGSGSFGHIPAKKHGTRQGVEDAEGWLGFVEVWKQAAELNAIVMQALGAAGLAAISFPPSASATAIDGEISSWDLGPIQAALAAGLVPVVYGDVAFDETRGGTILSTEELFQFLAKPLRPQRILLAANEAVYADYPSRETIIPEIKRSNFAELSASLRGSEAEDVTGGMLGKVQSMLDLVEKQPELEVRIFSGVEADAVRKTLLGDELGTRIGGDEA